MLTLAFEHPWWSVVFLLVVGEVVARVVGAVVEPLAPCRRGTCPRCHGTGSDVRLDRKEAP